MNYSILNEFPDFVACTEFLLTVRFPILAESIFGRVSSTVVSTHFLDFVRPSAILSDHAICPFNLPLPPSYVLLPARSASALISLQFSAQLPHQSSSLVNRCKQSILSGRVPSLAFYRIQLICSLKYRLSPTIEVSEEASLYCMPPNQVKRECNQYDANLTVNDMLVGKQFWELLLFAWGKSVAVLAVRTLRSWKKNRVICFIFIATPRMIEMNLLQKEWVG